MTSILDIKPELIRIKTYKDASCLFCERSSHNAIISEKEEQFYLCLDHFEALSKILKNFH